MMSMKVRIMGGPAGPLYRPLVSINQGRIVLGSSTPAGRLVFNIKGEAVDSTLSFGGRLHPDDLKQVLQLQHASRERERDDRDEAAGARPAPAPARAPAHAGLTRAQRNRALEDAIKRAKTPKVVEEPPPPAPKKNKRKPNTGPQPYNAKMKVVQGNIIDHPSFGRGEVGWVHDGKMCVAFEDKARVLMCGVF